MILPMTSTLSPTCLKHREKSAADSTSYAPTYPSVGALVAAASLNAIAERVWGMLRPAMKSAKLGAWEMEAMQTRSEEHTSELQSQSNLVCRLLLEKKKKKISITCKSMFTEANKQCR